MIVQVPGYSCVNNTRLTNHYATGNSISDCENKCNSDCECVAFLEPPPGQSDFPCFLYQKNCKREESFGWIAFIKNNASIAHSEDDICLQNWPSDPMNDVCPPSKLFCMQMFTISLFCHKIKLVVTLTSISSPIFAKIALVRINVNLFLQNLLQYSANNNKKLS